MTVTNFSRVKTVPKTATTRKSAPTTTNFAKGIFTYKPNDTMDYDEIYLAQNARFDRIGEYKTRRGLKALSDPVGLSTNTNWSTEYIMTSPTDRSIGIALSGNSLYSIKVLLAATSADDSFVVQCSIYDTEDSLVGVSCVEVNSTTAAEKVFVFKDGVKITDGYSARFSAQGTEPHPFTIGALEDNSALMWEIKHTGDTGQVTSVFEANIDGTKTILFTFKTDTGATTLYRMAANGTVTAVRTLPSGVTRVRYSQNVNQIRYVDGKEGPRLLNPGSSWSDSAISTVDLKTGTDLSIKTSNILAGTQDNMMYFDADTTTQAVWTYPYGFEYAPEADYTTSATLNAYVVGSTTTTTIAKSTLTAVSSTHLVSDVAVNDLVLDDSGNYGKITTISGDNLTVTSISHAAEPINSYDKFDRDFRQNFPAIKTGDPLTAMFNLGGVVYILTRRNKYYMYSQTADVWTQQASSAQHGTFSQESVVCDLNYAYYACDDGIYIFDGSAESSITEKTIQNTYNAITGKESIVLELYKNRLYVFYSSKGNGTNDSCLVYNINLKLWESFDTGTSVSATTARQTASNRFICGSSHFCQLFLYEDDSNDFADLGAPIDFDLETAYLHFGTPSQLHRITKWRPEFATTEKAYTVKCGYALDFTNDVKYAYSINLLNNKPVDEHYVWDNPPDYGNIVTPTKLTTIPKVYGQFRRCQIRYQHHAAFEPVNFKSHTLTVQTERIR